MTTAHIVTLRRAGRVFGYQLRTGRGAGQSSYFGAHSHGGPDKALTAAEAHAAHMGMTLCAGRGSPVGRRTKRSPTPAAGVRWEWCSTVESAVLYVVASWMDKGRNRCTRYSTEKHGLEGALDLAIAARTSAGAPMPDKAALLRALRRARRAGVPS
jgi:hypothetical protein